MAEKDWTPDDQASFEAMQLADDNPREDEADDEAGDDLETEGDGPDDSEGDGADDAGDEDEGDEEDDPRARKRVPLKALDSERNRRKALEKELNEAKLAIARFDERFDILSRGAAESKPKEEVKPPPEFDKDPIAFIENLAAETKKLADEREADRKAQEERTVETRLREASKMAVDDYKAKSAPDMDDALGFLVTSYRRERALLGVPPDQVEREIGKLEVDYTRWAIDQGKHPGEVFYKLAEAKGYVKKAKVEENDEAEADRRIDKIRETQQRNRGMSGSGGVTAPPSGMTGARLARMSDAEFAAYEAKHPDVVKRHMGG